MMWWSRSTLTVATKGVYASPTFNRCGPPLAGTILLFRPGEGHECWQPSIATAGAGGDLVALMPPAQQPVSARSAERVLAAAATLPGPTWSISSTSTSEALCIQAPQSRLNAAPRQRQEECIQCAESGFQDFAPRRSS
jgi:hypothetical protein